ncbi:MULTISPECIES: autorepressor SdpR family transcription factor [Bacillaceae]|uniref:autorepressor SdpR family transcription factor n=1 Tax=Alteribacter populi TaxID=2011011 RepID=UPI000BBAB994
MVENKLDPTRTFKALADDTRRDILELLREKDMTAGEIADAFEMTKPSISNHLSLLHGADLVYREKRGQYVVYSLNMTLFHEVVLWLQKLSQ